MSTPNQGILVVISGFSGAGKGTLMKELLSAYSDDYALSVSATSRGMREGEQEGVHYFYKTREQFEDMIAKGELIEYAQYVGNYYGTPKQYVLDQIHAGKSVILEIELQGAMNIKQQFPDTTLFFVSAPSADILYERLVGRGTETAEVIAQRMARAYEESLEVPKYDYLIINDDIKETTERLHNIITNIKNGNKADSACYLVSENLDFVNKMTRELLSYSKGE